ncbi:MAG: Hsp20/alpha crystallin family protein [Candidatus Omnitrophica bacterium]|nr:Hsp20/alpha crystallin family protein [Candidatus Omnitrophota bacterium]MDD5436409.1 Hsp20/alpha crystallin family protein [Candidatus Omnitrophota bacterium]
MKRSFIYIILSILAAGMVYAQGGAQVDDDYQNLDQTRERIVRMKKEMDKLMKEIVGPYADVGKTGSGIFGQDVRVDVVDNPKDIVVKADLPGMSKDKIDITLQNNKMLTIAGARDVMTRQESPGVVKQERMSGRFTRTIELPAECENSGIKATYEEGVLQIVLPKKKGVQEEAIKVNVQ